MRVVNEIRELHVYLLMYISILSGRESLMSPDLGK